MRSAPLLFALVSVGCLSTDALVPPTVDDDPALPRLRVPGTLLHGEVHGSPGDPLVVLLHGGPGADHLGMLRLLPLVDAGYQVLAYDQRGAGRSRRHDPGSFDAWSLTDDLAHLIDHHSPTGTAVLVGHSWGGQHAALAVQEIPDRVEAVVFLDPGPWTDERLDAMGLTAVDMSAPHLNDTMWAEQMVSPADHARMDLRFQELMSGQLAGYRMSEVDVMPFARMGYVSWGNVTAMGADGRGAADFDFAVGVDDWPGTAHFVWGGANQLMGPIYRADQEAPWPRATSLTLPGVGHDLVWVAADDVTAHLLEVL